MRKIKNFFKKDKESKSEVKSEDKKNANETASKPLTPRQPEDFEKDAISVQSFLTLLSTDKV